jgi:hypothetical protein
MMADIELSSVGWIVDLLNLELILIGKSEHWPHNDGIASFFP